MKLTLRSSAILVALALTACAHAPRSTVASASGDAIPGDYEFAGLVSGKHFAGTIRIPEGGEAALFQTGGPSGGVPCKGRQTVTGGLLTVTCGTVELIVPVANNVVAEDGLVSFSVLTHRRRARDPFACPVWSGHACQGVGAEIVTPVVRRETGKVAVRWVSTE